MRIYLCWHGRQSGKPPEAVQGRAENLQLKAGVITSSLSLAPQQRRDEMNLRNQQAVALASITDSPDYYTPFSFTYSLHCIKCRLRLNHSQREHDALRAQWGKTL